MSPVRTNFLLFGASILAIAAASAAPSAWAQEATATVDEDLQAVIVTGTRLGTTGFNAPTPVTVVGQEQFQNLGATSLYNVTKDIPVFRNSGGPDNQNSGVRSASQAVLDLRGLGGSRTLTLIDGNRPMPVNSSGTFDSGMIPMALVDRLDVVTGGASAAYGSDAVAGAVNIILKHRLEGLNGTLQYGQTQKGDVGEVQASLGWGHDFAGGKGHIVIGGDYVRNRGAGTMYTRDWGKKEPGLLGLPANRAAGLPANILANNVELISFHPGGLVTTGPLKGTAFAPGGTPYALQYGSLVGTSTQIGTSNPGMTAFYTTALRQQFRRHTAMLRAEYEFSPTVTGYAQLQYGALWSGGGASRQPNPGAYIVTRDNAYLPAATLAAMVAANLQTITVNRVNTEYGPSGSANRTELYQGVAGLNGSFNSVGGAWDWDVNGSWGKSVESAAFINIPNQANLYASAYAVRNAQGQIVCGPIATNPYFNAQNALVRAQLIANLDAGCVPSNIFGFGSLSPEAINYFLRAAEIRSAMKRYTATANLRGKPFSLPAGPVAVAVGLEWRRDEVDAVACDLCRRNALTSTNSADFAGVQNVKEAYGEIGVPVLKDLTLFQALDLNAAIRRTDYSLSGAVTTWKVGGTWDVTNFLRFRATRSRDIRAPNISELFNQGSMGVTNITNPRTGGTGIVGSQTVGNPNLVPEVAKTTVIGGVFSPKFGNLLDGFRVSVDHFDITVNGTIGSLGAQNILNGFFLQGIASYGQFIVQDSSVIGIASVSSSQSNDGVLTTDGFDVEIFYPIPLRELSVPGQLTIRALGTNTRHLKTIRAGTVSDTAGYIGGLMKWVWNVNINYDLGKLGVGLQVKTTSSVGYNNQLIGPDDSRYSPTLANSVNRNRWAPTIYYTLNAQYDLIAEAGRRLQIYGVVNNLLDKDPPILGGATFSGGSPYDTIGRAFKAGIRFQY